LPRTGAAYGDCSLQKKTQLGTSMPKTLLRRRLSPLRAVELGL